MHIQLDLAKFERQRAYTMEDGKPLVWADAGHEAILTPKEGRWLIEVRVRDDQAFLPHYHRVETDYPLELLARICAVKGPAWLADEVARDEDRSYVEKGMEQSVFSFVPKRAFEGARILDFGCGSGASTAVIARILPDTKIIGIELEPDFVDIARQRAEFYGMTNAEFMVSPSPETLPNLGAVDFVFLNAVYEHLLPLERRAVLPMLWEALKPGGVMFIYLTPYRWWPIEYHTTDGLPLINYLPDGIAKRYASKFGRADLRGSDWATMLRKGIRGGCIREIRMILPDAELLAPVEIGGKDGVDLWWHFTRKSALKRLFFLVLKALRIPTIRSLQIALRKQGQLTS